MKSRICSSIRNRLSNTASGGDSTAAPTGVDVREEYANAFRTESYNQFWTRVLAIPRKDSITCISPAGSSTADRLHSYRLFAEHLLEPDQPTVNRVLDLTRSRPETLNLLQTYFSLTANASVFCGELLKDIDRTRIRYRVFVKSLPSIENVKIHKTGNLPGMMITRLTELSNVSNPFGSSAPLTCQVRVIQLNCSELLKRLESSRDKARAKLRLINKLHNSSGLFLLALTASLAIIVASHALALLVASPALIAVSLRRASTTRLDKVSAQLDAAAKGTYILNRDLDTITRLVIRLSDELEHMQTVVKFWLAGGEDRLRASCEVARQLKNSDSSFSQQLDELEEHLYLCLMNINRSRNLVVNQLLDPGQHHTRDPNMVIK